MPKNGFVMRFFGGVQLSVGVVGAERSIQLSYGRMGGGRFARGKAPAGWLFYMDWGASTPSRSRALARVMRSAITRPVRWLVSSGSAGSFTRATL